MAKRSPTTRILLVVLALVLLGVLAYWFLSEQVAEETPPLAPEVEQVQP